MSDNNSTEDSNGDGREQQKAVLSTETRQTLIMYAATMFAYRHMVQSDNEVNHKQFCDSAWLQTVRLKDAPELAIAQTVEDEINELNKLRRLFKSAQQPKSGN